MPEYPPAGWYPDPEEGEGNRYWDGTQWSDRFDPPREVAQKTVPSESTDPPAGGADISVEVSKLRGRVKDALRENLAPGELIQVVIRGAHGQAIVGTGTRVFVLKPGWMAGATLGAEVTSWSYRNVVGVQVHKGMMSGAVIIQQPGSSGTKTSYWGSKGDDPAKAPNAIPVVGEWPLVKAGVTKLTALIDAAHTGHIPASDSSATEPNVASKASIADELSKLAELRDSGALSNDEFQAAKRRVIEQ
jgi:hypothetical protein